MNPRLFLTASFLVCLGLSLGLSGADLSGRWQAEFDSAIGQQKYLFTFQVEGGEFTGRALGEFAGETHESVISDGRIEGDKLTFVETAILGGSPIRIEYTGDWVEDRLRLKRKVGTFGTEELVATRVLPTPTATAVATPATLPPAAGPGPRGGRGAMPSAPQPGPCPLPILPALPAREDTSFYAVRDVPHGKVEPVTYKTPSGQDKRMHLYVPPGYDSSGDARYPVLYLNHGGGDDDAKWTSTDPRNGGHAQYILDNLIAEKKARPMILVMPNTRGLASANPPAPGTDDACSQEYLQAIIPYVESHYRVRPGREHRALAGLSMGGFVVMNTGLSHLDTFSELYVYSSGYFDAQRQGFADNFAGVLKDPGTNRRFRVPFYMAAGETDIALLNSQKTLAVFNQHGIRNFWVLSSGGHDWNNWRRYLHQTAQIMFPECDGP